MKIKISEIFFDLEGEGRYRGMPSIFIRLAECNLRCRWCDTKYAWKKGGPYETAKIAGIIKKSPFKHVVITGGEPLLQKPAIKHLLRLMGAAAKKKTITIETNGSLDVSGLRPCVISMDMKLPSSAEHEKMRVKNLHVLTAADQVKLVAASEKDLLFALKMLRRHPVKALVVAQPVYGRFTLMKIKKFIFQNRLNWMAGIQMHKLKEKAQP
ncbi:MAG TPA: radical SAM protein [bacterium]|nr:radical SAM protein [bacterium]